MKQTIESKVSETLLQKDREVKIGDATYIVAQPSIATLVLVSEEIAKIPKLDVCKESDILKWSLKNAKDCKFIGDIIATIILGAKGLKGKRKVVQKCLFGLIKTTKIEEVDYKEELSNKIINNHTPKELSQLIPELLRYMDVSSFFLIISFLQEIHLTKPTKENETTASGQ